MTNLEFISFEVVDISFNGIGINAGVYSSDIMVTTNDENNELVNIPATLTVTGAPNLSLDYQPTMTGINYGFFVGYGRNLDTFYAGAELFFDMNRQSGRIGGNDGLLGNFLARSLNRYTYGGALRLGMYAGPESMVYMRLGALGTKFRYKSTGDQAGRLSADTIANMGMAGFLYGFGVEMALDNHFSVRMDFDRIVYQAFNKDFTND